MNSRRVTMIHDVGQHFNGLLQEIKDAREEDQEVIIVQNIVARNPDKNKKLKEVGAQIVQTRNIEEADKVFREVAANVYKKPEMVIKECCSQE